MPSLGDGDPVTREGRRLNRPHSERCGHDVRRTARALVARQVETAGVHPLVWPKPNDGPPAQESSG